MIRGLIDGSPPGYGFNATTIPPDIPKLDAAQAKGYDQIKIWLGDLSGTEWQQSDATVTDKVKRVMGHPAVAFYHLCDEPYSSPENVAKVKARADLVRSLDPTKGIFVSLPISQPGIGGMVDVWDRWADSEAADIYGLVVYSKTNAGGYMPARIPTAIAAADTVGLPAYCVYVQDFGSPEAHYAEPTLQEVAQQFNSWATSRFEGYWVYRWPAFSAKPDHVALMRVENARDFEVLPIINTV